MRTIRITHRAGVGEWPHGAVVNVEDWRAQRLIGHGWAVAMEATNTGKRPRGRPRKDAVYEFREDRR